jgi:hypothetical protein
MEGFAAPAMSPDELLFSDGFGDRLLIRDPAGRPLHESLLIRSDLSAVPSFEFSLTQRLNSLREFDHPSFVCIRQLVRVPGRLPRLSLVADYCAGVRLSEVLEAMENQGAPRSPGAPLFIIRQILGAVGVLHRQNAEVTHGALAPDRIVIADGRVTKISDYVLGSAIEQLRFSPERYWKELRVAVPPSAGAVRFDKALDVAQIGTVALALFAGRQLRDEEHMGNLDAVLAGLTLPQTLQTWLMRTLHMDTRRAYLSVAEAESGLETAMSDAGILPAPLELGALGVRQQRAITISASRPAALKPAPPVAIAARPAVQPPKPEARRVHDSSPQTMYVGGASEADDAPRTSRFSKRFMTIVKIGAFGASLACAFTAAQYVPAPAFLFSRTGTLVVESKPQGVPLLVDGQPQGVTPVTLRLESGRHEVELHGGGKPRIFNVFVSRGARISQYIEMPSSRGRSLQPSTLPSGVVEPAAPVESLPAEPAPAQPVAAQPMSAPMAVEPAPAPSLPAQSLPAAP